MLERIKRYLTSESVTERIVAAYICLLVIFFTVVIISYFILPQGLLLRKHPLQNWDTAPSMMVSTLQIFFFNLISVFVIICSNLISTRKNKAYCFMPLGHLAFFWMITINGIVLGTWSFSVITDPVPLLHRITRTFDLFHKAGLWEMSGQLFILCATAGISLFMIDGREIVTKSWRTIRLSRQEIIVLGIGLLLMILGALVESYAILSLK